MTGCGLSTKKKTVLCGLNPHKATLCISAAGMVINCGLLVNVFGYQSVMLKKDLPTFMWLSIIVLNAVVSFVLLVGVERKEPCCYYPFLSLTIVRIGLCILTLLSVLFGFSTLIIDLQLYQTNLQTVLFLIATIWIEYYAYVVVKRSLNLLLEFELPLIN